MWCPVVDISATNACVAESFGANLETRGGLVLGVRELRLVVVAAHRVVLVRRHEA